jgi:hypothetical protein
VAGFTPSRWPFDHARAERLLAFQSSELRAAQVDVTDFWKRFGAQTSVNASDRVATVFAGFSFGGPGEHTSARVPVPAIWLWRLRLKALARLRERQDEGLRAEQLFEPGIVSSILAELPAYRTLHRTRPDAALALYRYASYLNALVPAARRGSRILEIGGGAGLVALGAAELLDSEQAVLVDLPQMLEVAFVVLSHFYGADALALPGEHERRDSARFVLLTPAQRDEVESGAAGVILNTASFQEMTRPMIHAYFDLIERAAAPGARFYCANQETSTRVGPEADFDSYPWRQDWRTLIDRLHLPPGPYGPSPTRERLVEVGRMSGTPESDPAPARKTQ